MSPARTPRKKTLGKVALVGAGPGDPGLLTVRAVELLAAADVVAADPAAHAAVLARHVRADAERVDTRDDTLTEADLARLLAKHGKEGRLVVALFAGDPFLAATGGELAGALARAGVPFEVVPGVPTATAVPAYAGVPLGAAQHAASVLVEVTDAPGRPDWSAYPAAATLVVRGPVGRLLAVAEELLAAGRAPATPALVTTGGSTTGQRSAAAPLDALAGQARAAGLDGEGVLVVGDAVGLREKLSWFESKPLFGWRVLVPRTREQAASLSRQLREHGAVPEEVPTISVEPPRTPQQMDRAIQGLVTGRYEWVAFTSTNAVRAVREKFEEYGLDARAFAGLKVAAVGEQTAAALRAWGIAPDLVPTGAQSSEGLVADWPPYDEVLDPINRVFLPRADIATENLVAGLVALGWEVDDVTAYRTVRAAPPPAPVREAIKGGGFDAVLFTSSSTVRNLVGIAGKPHPSTVVACIGPQTAKTAEEHGLRVDALAERPSVDALVAALAEFGAARRLAALQAGEPVSRPSERRPAPRRKAR
ncbi:MAG: uroporphyrinogen-III synthase [Actinomycetota bacterium]